MNKQYISAEKVAEIMGYSARQVYKVIRGGNEELEAQGYIIRIVRVPNFFERTSLN